MLVTKLASRTSIALWLNYAMWPIIAHKEMKRRSGWSGYTDNKWSKSLHMFISKHEHSTIQSEYRPTSVIFFPAAILFGYSSLLGKYKAQLNKRKLKLIEISNYSQKLGFTSGEISDVIIRFFLSFKKKRL